MGVRPVVALVAVVIDVEFSAFSAAAVVVQQFMFVLCERQALFGSVVVAFISATVVLVGSAPKVA